VRPLVIVIIKPIGSDLPNFIDRSEDVSVKHFVAVAPIEALHERILIRLPRLDVAHVDSLILAPIEEVRGDEPRTIVDA